jgi:hypothetical protein
MATVEFRYDPKNTAWFTANAAMVLKAGEPAYHDTTGLFKLGDGVTALSALSFLPTVSASTPTIQQVLTAGQVATTTIETTGFIKTGGLSTQFLKADGTIDSSTYLTTLGTAATSLTTTGSSGAATLIANVLNVPNYTLAGLGGTTLAAVNAQNLSVFAATTSSQLAGVISDETGTGALVFGTSPTFTTGITTPLINGTSGTLQIGTTDLVNIGNKVTTNQRLVRIGQDTAWIDIGSQSGSSARAAIYLNETIPDTANYALSAHQTSGQTYINGRTGVAFLIAGGIQWIILDKTATFGTGLTNYDFAFPSTNGTKLGTATSQKIGFWNATPVVQPAAVTTVQGFYNAMSSIGLIASGTITLPTGYARSFNNIAINTTGAAAANTDYYYFCTATLTFTLPTAVGNTNTYYIKVTSGTLTINTTSSQTIDGSLTIVTSVANTAFTLISDGTNWQII